MVIPEFRPITPESIDPLYRELIKAYAGPNEATQWSVRRQVVDILAAEQERVTRIYGSVNPAVVAEAVGE